MKFQDFGLGRILLNIRLIEAIYCLLELLDIIELFCEGFLLQDDVAVKEFKQLFILLGPFEKDFHNFVYIRTKLIPLPREVLILDKYRPWLMVVLELDHVSMQ